MSLVSGTSLAMNQHNDTACVLWLSHSHTPKDSPLLHPWHETSNNQVQKPPTSSLCSCYRSTPTPSVQPPLLPWSLPRSHFKWLFPRMQSQTAALALCDRLHSQGLETVMSTGHQARELGDLWHSRNKSWSQLIFISHEKPQRQSDSEPLLNVCLRLWMKTLVQ
jgi:hypothetical protein